MYGFATMVYQYNHHNSEHYPSSYHLFKTQFNYIRLSVPHRKHITFPLRALQVNAISILDIIYGPVFYLKHVSETGFLSPSSGGTY
jgi:hypothetical protein